VLPQFLEWRKDFRKLHITDEEQVGFQTAVEKRESSLNL